MAADALDCFDVIALGKYPLEKALFIGNCTLIRHQIYRWHTHRNGSATSLSCGNQLQSQYKDDMENVMKLKPGRIAVPTFVCLVILTGIYLVNKKESAPDPLPAPPEVVTPAAPSDVPDAPSDAPSVTESEEFDKCKEKRSEGVKAEAGCVLSVFDTLVEKYSFGIYVYDPERMVPGVAEYLRVLVRTAIDQDDLATSGEVLRVMDGTGFTRDEAMWMASKVPAYTAELKPYFYQALDVMSEHGMVYEVYERLLSRAIFELRRNKGETSGARDLRAYLIHFGCQKTAAVWSEITSDSSSGLPRGAPYPPIEMTNADKRSVAVQRIALRRDGAIPELQPDCPILMAKVAGD